MLDDADPDKYFAARELLLRVERRDMDAELPPSAESRGRTHWADLLASEDGRIIARSYGSGMSDSQAKRSALRRWVVEEEPTPAPTHRLP